MNKKKVVILLTSVAILATAVIILPHIMKKLGIGQLSNDISDLVENHSQKVQLCFGYTLIVELANESEIPISKETSEQVKTLTKSLLNSFEKADSIDSIDVLEVSMLTYACEYFGFECAKLERQIERCVNKEYSLLDSNPDLEYKVEVDADFFVDNTIECYRLLIRSNPELVKSIGIEDGLANWFNSTVSEAVKNNEDLSYYNTLIIRFYESGAIDKLDLSSIDKEIETLIVHPQDENGELRNCSSNVSWIDFIITFCNVLSIDSSEYNELSEEMFRSLNSKDSFDYLLTDWSSLYFNAYELLTHYYVFHTVKNDFLIENLDQIISENISYYCGGLINEQ